MQAIERLLASHSLWLWPVENESTRVERWPNLALPFGGALPKKYSSSTWIESESTKGRNSFARNVDAAEWSGKTWWRHTLRRHRGALGLGGSMNPVPRSTRRKTYSKATIIRAHLAGQEDAAVHHQDFPDDPVRPSLTAPRWESGSTRPPLLAGCSRVGPCPTAWASTRSLPRPMHHPLPCGPRMRSA